MASKKLKVTVVAGRNLSAKNGSKSDPYCEIVVLDDQGNKIGKQQYTKVLKGDLNPQWNQLVEFTVPSSFTGLKLRCWDKHRFRPDKFMGQITIKFNTALLSSSEKLDEWFDLKRRKTGEIVSGDIHLQIQYGDLTSTVVATSTSSDDRNRSSTVVGETPSNVDIRVSSNFSSEATNQKLQSLTHVVVEEEEELEDAPKEDYEKVREGPATAQLDPLVKGDKELGLTNKNLEVSNNSTDYYKVLYAKSNVAVNGGKWYFETRISITGQIYIGWCNSAYDPKKNTGDMWTFDGSRQQKFKNGTGSYYGEYWSNGDIIGCALDVDAKTIQYWRNGKDMGVAFTDVVTGGGRLMVVIGLVKRAKVVVNFGKDTFAFPQQSFNMLHSMLSEKELEHLAKLYHKYKEIGNSQTEQKAEMKDNIQGQGLLSFQKDLGIEDDEDMAPLIIMWKLKAETLWEISREEFMNGFTIYGCGSIDRMKQKLKDWREELKDSHNFRSFYNFVFDYLKEDKKILITEEAVVAWKTIMKGRMWPLFDDFFEFLRAEDKKSISRDAWQQLWHFMNTYPKTLKEYDTNSSWPIIFDEFVDWWNKEKNK